jgi:hypothetical protein
MPKRRNQRTLRNQRGGDGILSGFLGKGRAAAERGQAAAAAALARGKAATAATAGAQMKRKVAQPEQGLINRVGSKLKEMTRAAGAGAGAAGAAGAGASFIQTLADLNVKTAMEAANLNKPKGGGGKKKKRKSSKKKKSKKRKQSKHLRSSKIKKTRSHQKTKKIKSGTKKGPFKYNPRLKDSKKKNKEYNSEKYNKKCSQLYHHIVKEGPDMSIEDEDKLVAEYNLKCPRKWKYQE